MAMPTVQEKFPVTTEFLEAIQKQTRMPGLVSLLWLHPGSRVTPHCGHTNTRLRVHMPIIVPPDCGMRVGDQTFTWTEGRCLVFDDSFEHEVWNDSERPRVVLLFDIFNPEVAVESHDFEDQIPPTIKDRIRTFMTQANLVSIELDKDGDRLELEPEEDIKRLMMRMLVHHGLQSVTLENGKRVFNRTVITLIGDG